MEELISQPRKRDEVKGYKVQTFIPLIGGIQLLSLKKAKSQTDAANNSPKVQPSQTRRKKGRGNPHALFSNKSMTGR